MYHEMFLNIIQRRIFLKERYGYHQVTCHPLQNLTVLNGDFAENESNDYKLVIIGVVAAIAVLSAAVLVFRRLQH